MLRGNPVGSTDRSQPRLHLLLPFIYLLIFKYVPMWGAQIALRDFFAVSAILIIELNRSMAVASE